MLRLNLTSFILAGIAILLLGATAFAAPGGNGKGNGHGHLATGGNGNKTTVTLDQADPQFGDLVTFTIATSAEEPWLKVQCYQEEERVYFQAHGIFEDYGSEPVFTLGPTPLWMSGGASCTADLHESIDGRVRASTEFSVLP